MKPSYNSFAALCIGVGTLLLALPASAVTLPSGWMEVQSFDAATNGLVNISLPADTLNAARPALEDLRLYDDAGNEVPYLIERPVPQAKTVQAAKSFQVTLHPTSTEILIENDLTQPIEGVTLETAANQFIKSVNVECSSDKTIWAPGDSGQPIFRQFYGANQLRLKLPVGKWRWVRLTVDDERSQPVPFTGAMVSAAAAESTPVETVPGTISERDENPGETRLAVNLGAANLNIASIQFETTEPLFMRQVRVAVPEVVDGALRERTLSEGTIYRVAVPGQPAAEHLGLNLEYQVPSHEVLLLIQNGDSPPLPISNIRVERRPVYLMFLAQPTEKTFYLLTGNSQCVAPHYDLAAMNLRLKSVPVLPVAIAAIAANPDYRAPEVLQGVALEGAGLDISGWSYRKPVNLSGTGAQQLELDLDVLAHAQSGFTDLRLLHGTNQVPYIIEHTSIHRTVPLSVTLTNDSKNPQLSRWIITLPRAGLPLNRLTFAARTALFQRTFTLYEELLDERGDVYRHELASGSWAQTTDHPAKDFSLTLNDRVQSDRLVLETENGDNPPIALDAFTTFYPVTRILFKAPPEDSLYLYYGNLQAPPPNYDLTLAANQLLAADKKTAGFSGGEERLKSSWREGMTPGKGGIVLWGVLAVVVIGLLAIISRLLPKTAHPPQ